VSYFLTDHLGTTTALTDGSGTLVETLNYDSFGNNAGSARTRYTYTGRERDPDTGLLYYRARFYDPQLGRFISEDPIGLVGGINLFAYVFNNPATYTDPSGLCAAAKIVDTCNDPSSWPRRLRDARQIARKIGFRVNDSGIAYPVNGRNTPADVKFILEKNGFTPFINIEESHWGYDDYEGVINGNWYHISVLRGDADDRWRWKPWDPKKSELKPRITIHCEKFDLRPSRGHRAQWLAEKAIEWYFRYWY
jgi:RHS repeat-associated protein